MRKISVGTAQERRAAASRRYYATHKEEEIQRRRRYRAARIVAVLAQCTVYRAAHPSTPADRARWRATERKNHPEAVRARGRRFYAVHVTQICAQKRQLYATPAGGEKIAASCRRYYTKNKEVLKGRALDAQRLRKAGVSPARYQQELKAQGGRCKICGVHHSKLKVALATDHSHTTKLFRGLLCRRCNTGIGLFQDDVVRLHEALKYLARSERQANQRQRRDGRGAPEELCEVCSVRRGDAPRKTLMVDHCHRTGKIRGLLCLRCNLGLGALSDSPKNIRRAIKYLKLRAKRSQLGAHNEV